MTHIDALQIHLIHAHVSRGTRLFQSVNARQSAEFVVKFDLVSSTVFKRTSDLIFASGANVNHLQRVFI